jgi:hypothetical protein
VTGSNKSFFAWAETFGDAVAVAAVDRLVHHAEVIVLQGDSYLLKDRPNEVIASREPLKRVVSAGDTRSVVNRR